MHPQTVRKHARHYGVHIGRGPKRHSTRSNPAQFGEWLREYTGGPLPSSIKGLSELSGISEDAIRNHLYRLRKQARGVLGDKLWENEGIVVWKDIKGARIPDIAFDTVMAYVGRSGVIKFHIRLMDGSVHVFRYTAEQLEDLYEKKEGE